MVVLVEKIDSGTVDLFIEDTGFWFQLPKASISKPGIKEGSRIQIEFLELPEEEEDIFSEVGGFVKNPPKKVFTE